MGWGTENNGEMEDLRFYMVLVDYLDERGSLMIKLDRFSV